MASLTPSNATPNSNAVERRQLKAIALGLSIPLAVILTTVCGVLVVCFHRRHRKRSRDQKVVYQQPLPFITAARDGRDEVLTMTHSSTGSLPPVPAKN